MTKQTKKNPELQIEPWLDRPQGSIACTKFPSKHDGFVAGKQHDMAWHEVGVVAGLDGGEELLRRGAQARAHHAHGCLEQLQLGRDRRRRGTPGTAAAMRLMNIGSRGTPPMAAPWPCRP